MVIKPLALKRANELVDSLHRHHRPVVGHRFSLGVFDSGRFCGAAIVGRPVSASINQEDVAEVVRLVTDGTKNACSILYAASARVCREMGFDRIGTYILAEEPGVTLRASGWKYSHTTRGDTWDRPNQANRRRVEKHPTTPKQYWYKDLKI